MRISARRRALAGPRLHGGRALRLRQGLQPHLSPPAAQRDAAEEHVARGNLGRVADDAVDM